MILRLRQILFATKPFRPRNVRYCAAAIAILSLAYLVFSVTRTGVSESLRTEAWTQPERGWLYVLDTNNEQEEAYILLVDPVRGDVAASIRTGYAPDMTLSPDGKRLYVVSGLTGLGVLSVIDTYTGSVLKSVSVPTRIMYKSAPPVPSLTTSFDGRWLYLMNMRTLKPGTDRYWISTFDTAEGGFLPEEAEVQRCGFGRLIPCEGDWDLLVHCANTNDVRMLKLSSAGGVVTQSSISEPSPSSLTNESSPIRQRRRTALVSPSADGSRVGIFTDRGRVYEVDTLSQRTEAASTNARVDLFVLARAWPRSADGSRLYVGLGTLPSVYREGLGSVIDVFDTTSWQRLLTIKTRVPFHSFALNSEGTTIYTISPKFRSIQVINAVSGDEIRSMSHIGASPMFAAVVP